MNLPAVEPLLTSITEQTASLVQSLSDSDPIIVGIHTGGLWVAAALHQRLALKNPLYSLDISFYRDDYQSRGLSPKVQGSHLPQNLDQASVILVDDAIMSGRTLRAAINELFDYGRPACIKLVTLLDLGQRELPIQPDIVGQVLLLKDQDRIKLKGPSPLQLEWQTHTPAS